MNKVFERVKLLAENCKKHFEPTPIMGDEARNLAMSGSTEGLDRRFGYFIKETESNIKKAAGCGQLALMVHFYDSMIQTKMQDFADYFKEKGFETKINKAHNFVEVLW